jgi:hypothetical protein
MCVRIGAGQWRAFVNTVMNLGIPQNTDNFLTDWENTNCLLFYFYLSHWGARWRSG